MLLGLGRSGPQASVGPTHDRLRQSFVIHPPPRLIETEMYPTVCSPPGGVPLDGRLSNQLRLEALCSHPLSSPDVPYGQRRFRHRLGEETRGSAQARGCQLGRRAAHQQPLRNLAPKGCACDVTDANVRNRMVVPCAAELARPNALTKSQFRKEPVLVIGTREGNAESALGCEPTRMEVLRLQISVAGHTSVIADEEIRKAVDLNVTAIPLGLYPEGAIRVPTFNSYMVAESFKKLEENPDHAVVAIGYAASIFRPWWKKRRSISGSRMATRW